MQIPRLLRIITLERVTGELLLTGVIEVLYCGAPDWIEEVANDLAAMKYLDARERVVMRTVDLLADCLRNPAVGGRTPRWFHFMEPLPAAVRHTNHCLT